MLKNKKEFFCKLTILDVRVDLCENEIAFLLKIPDNFPIERSLRRKEKKFLTFHNIPDQLKDYWFVLGNKHSQGTDQSKFYEIFYSWINKNPESLKGVSLWFKWKKARARSKNPYWFIDGNYFEEQIKNKKILSPPPSPSFPSVCRKEQADFAADIFYNILQGEKYIAVLAEMQSGKTDIKIALANCAEEDRNIRSNIKCIVITSLNRKGFNDEQRGRLEQAGIDVFIATKKEEFQKLQDRICYFNKTGVKVIVMHDESDYGTDRRQIASKILPEIVNKTDCHYIGFSATNDELIFSKLSNDNWYIENPMKFIPSPKFKGTKYALDNNLVEWAKEPFYEIDDNGEVCFSNQGKIIASEFFAQNEYRISMIRLATKQGRNLNKHEVERLWKRLARDKGKMVKVVSAKSKHDNNFKLGNSTDWQIHTEKEDEYLIIHTDQKASRAETVGFHNYWYFYHDHSSDSVPFNTLAQRYGRCNSYKEHMPRIIVSNIDVIKVTAGNMPKTKFDKKLSNRMNKETSGDKVRITCEKITKKNVQKFADIINEELKKRDLTVHDLASNAHKNALQGVGDLNELLPDFSNSKDRDPKAKSNPNPMDIAKGKAIRSTKSKSEIAGYIWNGPYSDDCKQEYEDAMSYGGFKHGDCVYDIPLKKNVDSTTEHKTLNISTFNNMGENNVNTINNSNFSKVN